MNIFALDLDPEQAAQWHVDRHVVKMPLEYAQLLSTAHFMLDDVQRGYKPTHQQHPSAKWARVSSRTYEWLFELFRHTSAEYRYRYGRNHKSWDDLNSVLNTKPDNLPDRGFIPPFMAMPAEYMRLGQCVASYRDYYDRGKRDLHAWSLRPKPYWITEHD